MSGGGTLGLSMLGALDALWRAGRLERVRRYVGASVGALIGVLLCVGYAPREVSAVLDALDLARLASQVTCESLLAFPRVYGLMDATNILAFIEAMLEHKGFAADVTLRELHRRTRRSLHIVGYCLTDRTHVAFSWRDHGHLRVVDACRASISIPLIFPPVTIDGRCFIDGATLERAPNRFAKYGRRSLTVTLVPWRHALPAPTDTLPAFLGALLGAFNTRINDASPLVVRAERRRAPRPRAENQIDIEAVRSGAVLDFSLGHEDKRAMFESGVAAGERWLLLRGH